MNICFSDCGRSGQKKISFYQYCFEPITFLYSEYVKIIKHIIQIIYGSQQKKYETNQMIYYENKLIGMWYATDKYRIFYILNTESFFSPLKTFKYELVPLFLSSYSKSSIYLWNVRRRFFKSVVRRYSVNHIKYACKVYFMKRVYRLLRLIFSTHTRGRW